jgi:hypothetical protein
LERSFEKKIFRVLVKVSSIRNTVRKKKGISRTDNEIVMRKGKREQGLWRILKVPVL